MELEEVIRSLQEGTYKELEEKEKALKSSVKAIQDEIDAMQAELAKLTSRYGQLSGEMSPEDSSWRKSCRDMLQMKNSNRKCGNY